MTAPDCAVGDAGIVVDVDVRVGSLATVETISCKTCGECDNSERIMSGNLRQADTYHY